MNKHNVALIRALQASWSDPDPEILPGLFTPDGHFEDVTYGINIHGTDALRAYSARMKKHINQLRVDIRTCDATDETGLCEWHLSHVFSGNFDGVDCSGVPVAMRGLSVYQFRDGKIARASDYWNYMEIVRGVRVLPKELRDYRVA